MKISIESIAMICHEANRAYCAGIGDDSQQHWDDAPEWQRTSAINGVTFHLSNPDAGAKSSHESWMSEKLRDGWRYGPVKNADTKEHPCLIPYKELPEEQRIKDRLLLSIVDLLRAHAEKP